MATALARVDIRTVHDLAACGADAAYARLLAAGERPHFIALMAIDMALQDRRWTECRGAEKDALRARFDRLRRAWPPAMRDDARDAALDALGVVAPRD